LKHALHLLGLSLEQGTYVPLPVAVESVSPASGP
jgi:hypothetical protein